MSYSVLIYTISGGHNLLTGHTKLSDILIWLAAVGIE